MIHLEFCPIPRPPRPFQKGVSFTRAHFQGSWFFAPVIYHILVAGLWRISPLSAYLRIFLPKIQAFAPTPLQKVVVFLLVEIEKNLLTSQVEFVCAQNGWIDTQPYSRDQLKREPLLCLLLVPLLSKQGH